MENDSVEMPLCKKLQPQVQQLERYLKVIPPHQPVVYHSIPHQVYRTPVSVYVNASRKARILKKETKEFIMTESFRYGKELKKAEELTFITEITWISCKE